MEKRHPKNAAGTREIINERTGRDMPQAIATGTGLVVLILMFLLFLPRICFVALILLFMLLAIRELQVSFSLVAIHLPAVVLDCGVICVLLATYYAHDHVAAAGASLVFCLLASSAAAAADPYADRFGGKALEAKKLGVRGAHPPAMREVTFSGRARDVSSSVFVTLYIVLLASFLVLLLVRPQYRILEAMALFVPSLSDIGGLVFGAAFGKFLFLLARRSCVSQLKRALLIGGKGGFPLPYLAVKFAVSHLFHYCGIACFVYLKNLAAFWAFDLFHNFTPNPFVTSFIILFLFLLFKYLKNGKAGGILRKLAVFLVYFAARGYFSRYSLKSFLYSGSS